MATGYVIGDHVPGHFNGSIVAASYFASLCGCVLTIELLHRRGTALNNLRSWYDIASPRKTLADLAGARTLLVLLRSASWVSGVCMYVTSLNELFKSLTRSSSSATELS